MNREKGGWSSGLLGEHEDWSSDPQSFPKCWVGVAAPRPPHPHPTPGILTHRKWKQEPHGQVAVRLAEPVGFGFKVRDCALMYKAENDQGRH